MEKPINHLHRVAAEVAGDLAGLAGVSAARADLADGGAAVLVVVDVVDTSAATPAVNRLMVSHFTWPAGTWAREVAGGPGRLCWRLTLHDDPAAAAGLS